MHTDQGKAALHFITESVCWSDGNRFAAAIFGFCIKTMSILEKIEADITQNETNSVHSVIAHDASRIPVYKPSQRVTVAQGAQIEYKRPYSVQEITAQDLCDFNEVLKEKKQKTKKKTLTMTMLAKYLH